MDGEDLDTRHRSRLFAIAYRMLGEVGEAEDAVQETFLRWSQADRADIDEPGAWLTTVVSRICVDRLRSARRRREQYVGPWLPEPVATDARDPHDSAELADSLRLAFLVVLERLSPLERAAFLLHDVFGYRHTEVAAMLDRTPASVRKVATRARAHLAEHRPRYEPDSARRDAVVRAFVDAVAGADLDALLAVLAPDISFTADGGGVVAASRHPQHGAERVAGVVVGLARLRPPDWDVVLTTLNGETAVVVVRPDGTPDSAWTFATVEDRVSAIEVIRNPHKLAALDVGRSG